MLETGNRLLATTMAGEWLFWRTGNVDFLTLTIEAGSLLRVLAARRDFLAAGSLDRRLAVQARGGEVVVPACGGPLTRRPARSHPDRVSSALAPMAIAPGARIGRYDVVALLGAGGMGEVYRARDTKLNRDVAIKVLPIPSPATPNGSRGSPAKPRRSRR